MAKGESKSYVPAEHERPIFEMWERGGHFHVSPDARPPEKRFSMVIPPPNVTGALHLGHALNNTLQDILIRRHRMMGDNTLWVVGTDHAGIATQAVVEKTIRKEEGKSRHDLGREELVRRIWEWKEKYGGRIVEQLKLMGCSCDYERERFTLDEGCAKAVRETFFKMFRDGLIYRGKRLVNWDTQLQTAVADDEVYHESVKGHFYTFKYPIKEPKPGEPTHVHIATTRPETMLADTAVAVHPDPAAALDKAEKEARAKLADAAEKEKPGIQAQIDDIAERRTSLLPTLLKLRDMAKGGRAILLPLVDREIPLICDEWADPSLGTGCVKITPGHDFNDYEVGQRNKLPVINVMTPDGRVNEHGGAYKDQKFADARKKVVEDLEKLGLVEKIEDRQIDLAHSDRSNSPIEPFLSDQWFVKMGDLPPDQAAKIEGLHGAPGLAQMAIDAVKSGKVKVTPGRYEKTYTDWLSEKRDWCISRQLWWGHRIPVWRRRLFVKPGNYDYPPMLSLSNLGFGIKKTNGADLCGLAVDVQTGETLSLAVSEMLCNAELEGEFEIFLCILDSKYIEYFEARGFEQDPDVLDTWFSSALWPHSTLGWPDAADNPQSKIQNPKSPNLLDYYYPTNVLSTAREIITLWVARMVITGLYNLGEIPFHNVYIHPVIQDGQGRKMSKSLGNGVDPVDIIDEYGADALRFTLAELTTETQDIRMPVKPKKLPDGRQINISEKFEKGRNFCNKLWQAATGFVIPNLEGYAPKPIDPKSLGLVDRWVLSRMTACIESVNEALARYKFSDAVGAVYRFMWDEYCSWYIEMAKPRLGAGAAPAERATAQQILAHVLDQLLRVLHPIVPFVTEAIWEQLNKVAPQRGLREIKPADGPLIAAPWPMVDAVLRDAGVESQMSLLHDVIKGVRDIRSVVNDYRGKAKQPSLRTLPKVLAKAGASEIGLLNEYRTFVEPLAGCDALDASISAVKPAGAMTRIAGTVQIYAPVNDLVDLSEVKRTEEARLGELRDVLAREEARLSNADFVARADAAVVEAARGRAGDLRDQIKLIQTNLSEMN